MNNKRELTLWGSPLSRVRGTQDLFDQLNRIFDEPWGGSSFLNTVPAKAEEISQFIPAVDVHETDESIVVTAEAPGLKQEDFDITLGEDRLTLSGKKEIERSSDNGERFHLVERRSGSFQRTLPLSAQVDADKVDAEFKNGVLTITLPKLADEGQKPRKISVR